MERDGSGVSALLGLDGFVVCAQLLEVSTGEWWLAVETTEIGPRARGAVYARSATAGAGWLFGTSRSLIGRSCWCGPNACGAVPSRCVRPALGPSSPTRSPRRPC